MYINKRYETTHLVVERLQQLLEAAGLHELATRLRGIEITDPAAARVVHNVLRRGPVPTDPELKEWYNLALANVERALKPDASDRELPAAA